MQFTLNVYFIAFALIALLSILLSRSASRLGIPILVVFLGIGMLAGSEGLGGIYFDDPLLTQWISTIALAIILFSGGVDTEWKAIKKVVREGIALATLGVLLTAGLVGLVAHLLLKLPILEGLLIGAIVSSTDAAAVFSVLRSKGLKLKGKLAPLLEFESGSNDPMAIFLTIGLLELIQLRSDSTLDLLLLLALQFGIGALVGWLASRLSLFLVNRLKLGYEGLYPVTMFALVFLTFGIASALQGSGYLAVYLLGLLLGREDFLHKRSILRFFDGNAWLMQIALFVTLGLLVFPSQLIPVIVPGLLISFFLMFIARPIAVFICLSLFKYDLREKVLVSWVGLKGAVPIVLATFPLVEGLPRSGLIFNLTFFVVLTSVLFQGSTLSITAKWLKLLDPSTVQRQLPIELTTTQKVKGELLEVEIPPKSPSIGKAIYQLGLPPEYLVILIERAGMYIQPNGSVVIQQGDVVLSLSELQPYEIARQILQSGSVEVINPSA
jgi:potassium/hydrogen antiporter